LRQFADGDRAARHEAEDAGHPQDQDDATENDDDRLDHGRKRQLIDSVPCDGDDKQDADQRDDGYVNGSLLYLWKRGEGRLHLGDVVRHIAGTVVRAGKAFDQRIIAEIEIISIEPIQFYELLKCIHLRFCVE